MSANPFPLVYELNTRCWLNELSSRHRRPIRLGDVPEEELQFWENLGFTHVWLMGVWRTGVKARQFTLDSEPLRRRFRELMPEAAESDLGASPFAVSAYELTPALGSAADLDRFRHRLQARGLKLILDFVPNHVGLDHPWLRERPELFVPGRPGDPASTECRIGSKRRWFARGRDPFYPPWPDVVQLDYRSPETRRMMIHELQGLVHRCDGVRCDMAMLLINDIFGQTWRGYPRQGEVAANEFWPEAIHSVRSTAPAFLFVAEAYWNTEAKLESFGFDYMYDKSSYDFLVARNLSGLKAHLLGQDRSVRDRSVHFLENHDEPRASTLFNTHEHRAAALVTLGLPGMRLLHEGQLTGVQHQVPVQFLCRPLESENGEIRAMYSGLLDALKASAVGKGVAQLLEPRPAWASNPTAGNFVVVQWQGQSDAFDLVVVNLASHRGQCFVAPSIAGLADRNWRMEDRLGWESYERSGREMVEQGLYLDVPQHGAQLFHFRPL